jgi:hypothetical protein
MEFTIEDSTHLYGGAAERPAERLCHAFAIFPIPFFAGHYNCKPIGNITFLTGNRRYRTVFQ